MNLKRTSATHCRCTFTNCNTPNDRLRTISEHMRFMAIKTKSIFIPAGARACEYHSYEHNWCTNNSFSSKFNSKQIEDMVRLLCNANSNDAKSSGNKCSYFFRLAHLCCVSLEFYFDDRRIN